MGDIEIQTLIALGDHCSFGEMPSFPFLLNVTTHLAIFHDLRSLVKASYWNRYNLHCPEGSFTQYAEILFHFQVLILHSIKTLTRCDRVLVTLLVSQPSNQNGEWLSLT